MATGTVPVAASQAGQGQSDQAGQSVQTGQTSQTSQSVQTGQSSQGGQVVVGVDDSPGGLAAMRWALQFALARRKGLVAVRTWELGLPQHGGRRQLPNGRQHVIIAFAGTESREAASRLARAMLRAAGGPPPGLPVTIATPEGNPGQALTRMAPAGDNMIVVGTTRGHHLKRAVHGSVGGYCARHARCPVVLVPGGPSRAGGPGRVGGEGHAGSRW